jgi:hypothetical protein
MWQYGVAIFVLAGIVWVIVAMNRWMDGVIVMAPSG